MIERFDASYYIDIRIDGSSRWRSSANLEVSGTPGFDPSVSLYRSGHWLSYGGLSEMDGEYAYSWGDYQGSIDLGYLDAGDSFELTYVMNTAINYSVWDSNYSVAATARIGDPFHLSDGGTTAPTNPIQLSSSGGAPAPVPEPGTIFLLSSGLLGFVGFRRRFGSNSRFQS
jgi:hypothetical protein